MSEGIPSGIVRVKVRRDWLRFKIAHLTMPVVEVVMVLSSSLALLWIVWRRRGKARQNRT